MTVFDVDRTSFSALCLAQGAINFARSHLPYGSANQRADWKSTRGGESPQGQTLPRLDTTRDATTVLLKQAHEQLPTYFGSGDDIFAAAISAGVALYYGAGNCGEHADLTFSFLGTFGFPDIEVSLVSSTIMDHAFALVSWDGCADPVVCDAWPTDAQACLWSHFFANPKREQPDPGYKTVCRYEIAEMGHDLVGDAFRAVDPARVSTLKPQSKIKGLSDSVVQQILRRRIRGLYDHTSTLSQALQSGADYRFETNLMSQSTAKKEEWSAKVLPVITDVGSRLEVLDPDKRYAGTRK